MAEISGAAAGRAAAEVSAAEDGKSEAIRRGFELALLSYVLSRAEKSGGI